MSASFRRTSILTAGDEEFVVFHDDHPHCLTIKYGVLFPVWTLITSDFHCWFKFWLSVKSLNPLLDLKSLTLFQVREQLKETKGCWKLIVSNHLIGDLMKNLHKHPSFDSWSQSKMKPLPSPPGAATKMFIADYLGKPNFFHPDICAVLRPWKIIYPIAI